MLLLAFVTALLLASLSLSLSLCVGVGVCVCARAPVCVEATARWPRRQSFRACSHLAFFVNGKS